MKEGEEVEEFMRKWEKNGNRKFSFAAKFMKIGENSWDFDRTESEWKVNCTKKCGFTSPYSFIQCKRTF